MQSKQSRSNGASSGATDLAAIPEDKKIPKLHDAGSRGSGGINLEARTFEEVLSKVSNEEERQPGAVGVNFGRRRRQREQEAARALREAKEAEEKIQNQMRGNVKEHGSPSSKSVQSIAAEGSNLTGFEGIDPNIYKNPYEKVYKEWVKLETDSLVEENSNFHVWITEKQGQDLMNFHDHEKVVLLLEYIGKNTYEEIQRRLDLDRTTSSAQRKLVSELTNQFTTNFIKDITSQVRSIQMQVIADQTKKENPENIYQMDKQAVLKDLERVVTEMEDSVNSAYTVLRKDYYAEFNKKLDDAYQNLKVVEFDEDLENKFRTVWQNRKHEFEHTLEIAIEEAIMKEKKIEELFLELQNIQVKVQEAESKCSKQIMNQFNGIISDCTSNHFTKFIGPS
jgi:hypothetical protein